MSYDKILAGEPKTYRKVVGKSGKTWLIGNLSIDEGSPANHIYVTNHKNPDICGEGFAGKHLVFIIDDGTEFILKGGWHSNADALLNDTGIDMTKQYRMYIAVAEEFESRSPEVFKPPLLYDNEFIGSWDDAKGIIRDLAIKAGKPLAYKHWSVGGASSGYEHLADRTKCQICTRYYCPCCEEYTCGGWNTPIEERKSKHKPKEGKKC